MIDYAMLIVVSSKIYGVDLELVRNDMRIGMAIVAIDSQFESDWLELDGD